MTVRRVQVAIVGGGPAGLAAATAAAEAGVEVVLFDEGDAPGGELRYRVVSDADFPDLDASVAGPPNLDPGEKVPSAPKAGGTASPAPNFGGADDRNADRSSGTGAPDRVGSPRIGGGGGRSSGFGGEVGAPPVASPAAQLAESLARTAASGTEVRSGALVWSLSPDNRLAVSDGQRSEEVAAEVVVLATGSTDDAPSFPGATLPGVWTGRAVRLLLNLHRVRPGRRFAIVGGAPEGVEVAKEIWLARGEVVAVAAPDVAVTVAVAVEGDGEVERVRIGDRWHAVDVVVVAAGRHPDAALAQLVGCALGYDAALGGWLPLVDADLRALDGRLLVAGNAAGVCGPRLAAVEGRLAGLSAAAALGVLSDDDYRRQAVPLRESLAARFAARARLHPAFIQTYR